MSAFSAAVLFAGPFFVLLFVLGRYEERVLAREAAQADKKKQH